MHQGWQTNYPSMEEHVDLVEKQFEAEKLSARVGPPSARKLYAAWCRMPANASPM